MSIYYEYSTLLTYFLAITFITLLCAYLVGLMVEVPFINLNKLLFKKEDKKKVENEMKE